MDCKSFYVHLFLFCSRALYLTGSIKLRYTSSNLPITYAKTFSPRNCLSCHLIQWYLLLWHYFHYYCPASNTLTKFAQGHLHFVPIDVLSSWLFLQVCRFFARNSRALCAGEWSERLISESVWMMHIRIYLSFVGQKVYIKGQAYYILFSHVSARF